MLPSLFTAAIAQFYVIFATRRRFFDSIYWKKTKSPWLGFFSSVASHHPPPRESTLKVTPTSGVRIQSCADELIRWQSWPYVGQFVILAIVELTCFIPSGLSLFEPPGFKPKTFKGQRISPVSKWIQTDVFSNAYNRSPPLCHLYHYLCREH